MTKVDFIEFLKGAAATIFLLLFGGVAVYSGLGFCDGYIHIFSLLGGAIIFLMGAAMVLASLDDFLFIIKRKVSDRRKNRKAAL